MSADTFVDVHFKMHRFVAVVDSWQVCCMTYGKLSSLQRTASGDAGILSMAKMALGVTCLFQQPPTVILNENVPIHLAQCWFLGLAIFSAKIWKQFFLTALGNCYGLELAKC